MTMLFCHATCSCPPGKPEAVCIRNPCDPANGKGPCKASQTCTPYLCGGCYFKCAAKPRPTPTPWPKPRASPPPPRPSPAKVCALPNARCRCVNAVRLGRSQYCQCVSCLLIVCATHSSIQSLDYVRMVGQHYLGLYLSAMASTLVFLTHT